MSGALAPQHQALIDASAITADVAKARGISYLTGLPR
jgi:hypothetical protein